MDQFEEMEADFQTVCKLMRKHGWINVTKNGEWFSAEVEQRRMVVDAPAKEDE